MVEASNTEAAQESLPGKSDYNPIMKCYVFSSILHSVGHTTHRHFYRSFASMKGKELARRPETGITVAVATDGMVFAASISYIIG